MVDVELENNVSTLCFAKIITTLRFSLCRDREAV